MQGKSAHFLTTFISPCCRTRLRLSVGFHQGLPDPTRRVDLVALTHHEQDHGQARQHDECERRAGGATEE